MEKIVAHISAREQMKNWDTQHYQNSILGGIEGALGLFTHHASRKGIELLSNIQTDVPTQALGDQTRLRQILVNLLDNAIKFTHQGKIVVSVAVRRVVDTDFTLHCAVSDTGIGVAPEKVPMLFTPFTQADISRTRKYGGTGLGLAICKRLCGLMDGSILIESKVGVGSIFHFTIQLEKISKPMKQFVRFAGNMKSTTRPGVQSL